MGRDINGRNQIEIKDNFGSDDGSEYESAGTRQCFNSAKEMTDAMKNPAYKKSESYRNVVKQIIANSDPVALGLARDTSHDGDAEFHQGVMMSVRELFSDPRYKTDARYREEVKQVVAKYGDTYFPEMSAEAIRLKGTTQSIELGTGQETGPMNPNASNDGDE